jgi:uncharacterized protein (UPF0297 family)
VELILRGLGSMTEVVLLTDSFRVATTLTTIGVPESCIYLALRDKTLATELHTNAGMHVYLAGIDDVARDLRRKVDCIFFDFDQLSLPDFIVVGETITHGAKDGTLSCFMSSCNGTDPNITKLLDTLTQCVGLVYNSDADNNKKCEVYLKTLNLIVSAAPWKLKETLDNMTYGPIEKYLSRYIGDPTEEEPEGLGARDHAALAFVMRQLASTCLKTMSIQIPDSIYLIDDGKISTGIAYISRTKRVSASVDMKRYKSICFEDIMDNPPEFYRLIGIRRRKIRTAYPKSYEAVPGLIGSSTADSYVEESGSADLDLIVKDVVSTNPNFISRVKTAKKTIDRYAAEQVMFDELNSVLHNDVNIDRMDEIRKEINEKIEAMGGKENVTSQDLAVIFSSYPELDGLYKTIKAMTGESTCIP